MRKPPPRYRVLFPGVLAREIPDSAADRMRDPDAAQIMQRLQAHATEYAREAHYPAWPAHAVADLDALRRLAGRTDACALFQAGMLVQRINDAAPLIAGLQKLRAAVKSSEKATEASTTKRAAKAERQRVRVLNAACVLRADGKDPRAVASTLAKRKGMPSVSHIRKILSAADT